MAGGVLLTLVVVGCGLGRPDEPSASSASRASLEADPDSATALGRELLTTIQPGTCVAPDETYLGSLAEAGEWVRVCGFGLDDGSNRGVQIIAADDMPVVVFSDSGPIGPYTCNRRVTGDWWVSYPSQGASGCADGYRFHAA